MKRNSLLFATALLIGLTGCKNTPVQKEVWISNALDAASYQLKLTAEELLRNKQVATLHILRL